MKEKNMCESSDYYKLTPKQERYLKAKSTADVILGCVGSVVLSPVFLAIACAIKIEDGITAPVIFKQKRVGCGDECFQMYKFRSMKLDTPHDCPTHLLENPEQYITKVGKFLRKTSLDELPQLWNIAAGKLAVVGPRPALWNQDDLISRVSSKVQKKFINSQRSCLSVGFSHFYGCFRHRTPTLSNIMLWICL